MDKIIFLSKNKNKYKIPYYSTTAIELLSLYNDNDIYNNDNDTDNEMVIPTEYDDINFTDIINDKKIIDNYYTLKLIDWLDIIYILHNNNIIINISECNLISIINYIEIVNNKIVNYTDKLNNLLSYFSTKLNYINNINYEEINCEEIACKGYINILNFLINNNINNISYRDIFKYAILHNKINIIKIFYNHKNLLDNNSDDNTSDDNTSYYEYQNYNDYEEIKYDYTEQYNRAYILRPNIKLFKYVVENFSKNWFNSKYRNIILYTNYSDEIAHFIIKHYGKIELIVPYYNLFKENKPELFCKIEKLNYE